MWTTLFQILCILSCLLPLSAVGVTLRTCPSSRHVMCFLLTSASVSLICQNIIPILTPFAIFGKTALALWSLLLTTDACCCAVNPFLPYTSEPVWYHIMVWPLSIVYAISFPLYFDSSEYSDYSYTLAWRLPHYISAGIQVIVLLVTWRRTACDGIKAHHSTRRQQRIALRYVVLFCINVAISLTITFVESSAATLSSDRDSYNILMTTVDVLQLIGLYVIFHDDTTFGQKKAKIDIEKGADIADIPNGMLCDLMHHSALGIWMAAERMKKTIQVSENDSPTEVVELVLYIKGAITGLRLSFRDTSPHRFNALRQLDNISLEDYQTSFTVASITKENCFENKQGQLYYYTADRRFVVQAITETQYTFLTTIMSEYAAYLKAHPSSLLTRICGAHSMSLPIGTRRLFFLVMKNMFPLDLEQRFELKGSTDKRQALDKNERVDYLYSTRKGGRMARTMLDMDYLCMHQDLFHFEVGKQRELQNQIVRDALFLSKQNIMNFKLRLGVKFLPSSRESGSIAPLLSSPHPTSLNRSHTNLILNMPLLSLDLNRNYYIGIIDILTEYTWKCKVERIISGYLCARGVHSITIVPPEEYSSRLIRFVRDKLFTETIDVLSERPSTCTPDHQRRSSRASSAMTQVLPCSDEYQGIQSPQVRVSL